MEREMKKEKITKVNYSMYSKQIEQIQKVAEYHGRSVSNMLRRLIEREYERLFGSGDKK